MTFPKINNEDLIKRLAPPAGCIDMVLDTDTYNEIDDQFALVYSFLCPENMNIKAVYAAPYYNDRSTGPADGMMKSYEEILRLLKFLNIPSEGMAFKGSDRYMKDGGAVKSEAVDHLIETAMSMPDDKPLYVAAIGAITNVSSAIAINPDIIKKIVVVWLGGNSTNWHTAREFNLMQDYDASRLIFDCGVPVVQLPCQAVTSHLQTSVYEIEAILSGTGALGDYLVKTVHDYALKHGWQPGQSWGKVIWDISAVAWLKNPAWAPSKLIPSPILNPDLTWSHDYRRHLSREVYQLNRDAIFNDLFGSIREFTGK